MSIEFNVASKGDLDECELRITERINLISERVDALEKFARSFQSLQEFNCIKAPEASPFKNLMTAAEFAQKYPFCSSGYVLELIRHRDIECKKIGNTQYFSPCDIMAEIILMGDRARMHRKVRRLIELDPELKKIYYQATDNLKAKGIDVYRLP